MDKPLVSICIPCYNAALYLDETLRCLLNQSYPSIEILIVDDHSTDESQHIIQKSAVADNRIKFKLANGKGASAARNQAYLLSTSKNVIFFDADDWVPTNFIETQLNLLKANTEIVVAKWGRFYNNNLATIEVALNQVKNDLTFKEWVITYWRNVSHMTCPGRVLIPRNLIDLTGLWDEDLTLNDDFAFYTRLFAKSSIIRYNNESLFYYRSGIKGLSSEVGRKAYQSLFLSITRSVAVAQSVLAENEILNKCYANLLQHFIYESYPDQTKLLKKAGKMIEDFGGSDLKFPVGGKTKLANCVFGWKLVKKIKLKLTKSNLQKQQ